MSNTEEKTQNELVDAVIKQSLKYVVFDGWSDRTLKNACFELKISKEDAQKLFPRGGVDLALAFHQRDDNQFLLEFTQSDSNEPDKKVRDRIESAIINRLLIANKNKEAVKRSISLLSSPLFLTDGTKSLWNTADKIWVSIGDQSDDLNWYSKRLILSSVYSSVMIFWIEDQSENFQETRDFVKRRINEVMLIERFKSDIKKSSFWRMCVPKFEASAAEFFKFKEKFPGW